LGLAKYRLRYLSGQLRLVPDTARVKVGRAIVLYFNCGAELLQEVGYLFQDLPGLFPVGGVRGGQKTMNQKTGNSHPPLPT
jgi:hypothetical protein